ARRADDRRPAALARRAGPGAVAAVDALDRAPQRGEKRLTPKPFTAPGDKRDNRSAGDRSQTLTQRVYRRHPRARSRSASSRPLATMIVMPSADQRSGS